MPKLSDVFLMVAPLGRKTAYTGCAQATKVLLSPVIWSKNFANEKEHLHVRQKRSDLRFQFLPRSNSWQAALLNKV
jgi:hypothetical protein